MTRSELIKPTWLRCRECGRRSGFHRDRETNELYCPYCLGDVDNYVKCLWCEQIFDVDDEEIAKIVDTEDGFGACKECAQKYHLDVDEEEQEQEQEQKIGQQFIEIIDKFGASHYVFVKFDANGKIEKIYADGDKGGEKNAP